MLTIGYSKFDDDFITVFVGPQKTRFLLPSWLLAERAKPLYEIVSNGMRARQERIAYLPFIDPEVFQHFHDWVISNVYWVPQTDIHGRAEYSTNEKSRTENVPSREIGGEPTNLTRFYCTVCKKSRCMPANVMIRWWCNACQLASYEPKTARSAIAG